MTRSETLILAHPNTDFDALASMLAAQLLYPESRICMHAGVNRNVRKFFNLHADQIPHIDAGSVDPGQIERVILVEVASDDRLGPFRALAETDSIEVIRFVHEPGDGDIHDRVPGSGGADTSGDRGGSPRQRGLSIVGTEGALSTTMLKLLVERGVKIPALHATALALGIHEDTGSLVFASTTIHDAEALTYCLRLGADQEMLDHYLRAPLSPHQLRLYERLQGNLRVDDLGGLRILVAACDVADYVENVAEVAARLGDLTEWDAMFVCVGADSRVQVVGRSRTEGLSVYSVLKPLGGGGHPQAGSAVMRNMGAADALAAVLDRARAVARPAPCASDLMSTPVSVVPSDQTISAALVDLQRLGFNGAPIVDEDDLVGVVMREDLHRARRHGLGHAPVKGVMSGGVPTVGAGVALPELRDILAAVRATRLVVVDSGDFSIVTRLPRERAHGIVTPKDVLKALSSPEMAMRPPANPEASRRLRERIGQVPRLSYILPAVQRAAIGHRGVYLVGGAVRDVLLGERGLDLDLMVEGDAIAFARELAHELGAQCHPHVKFHTASIRGETPRGEPVSVDVATARSEYYESPGALPLVERSSLQQDLARRDFTINAMAASLKADDFGSVYDFFEGYRDLNARVTRVLHNLSFVEDPTRIFRAVRYEARLGFKMDTRTHALAKGCVDMHLVSGLTPARIRDEVMLILGEKRVGVALRRMEELGVLAALHSGLTADGETVELIEAVDALVDTSRWGVEVRKPLIRLACVARSLPSDELYDWMSWLTLRRVDQDVCAGCVTTAPRVVGVLGRRAHARSEVHRLLRAQPMEVAVMALVLARHNDEVSALLRAWLTQDRNVALEITGYDLIERGVSESPAVGHALRRTLELKVDGIVSGREEELLAAQRIARESASR